MQGEGKARGESPSRWTHSRARTSKVILGLGPGDLGRAGGSVMHTYPKDHLGAQPRWDAMRSHPGHLEAWWCWPGREGRSVPTWPIFSYEAKRASKSTISPNQGTSRLGGENEYGHSMPIPLSMANLGLPREKPVPQVELCAVFHRVLKS